MEAIREIVSQPALDNAFEVLKQLRPHLNLAGFHQIYDAAQKADGYTLVGYYRGPQGAEECLGVMGYRILHDFVRGAHLYIDDLVTAEAARSQGIGAKLLGYAEKETARRKLKDLRLCAVLENESGLRFYGREGWTRRAYAFTKRLGTLA